MRRLFLALCLLSVVPLVAHADGVIWPVRPPAGVSRAEFPAPRLDQLNVFLNHIYQARSHPVDLVFDGDSITDLWQNTGHELFHKLYDSRNVIDFGIGGDRTENVIWRLQHGELDGLHPKLAMLMIGTNNLADHNTPQDIADAIKKIIDLYRAKCPETHILLLGVFPRGATPADPFRDPIKQINALISKFDDGQHVTYLDIGAKFLQPDGTLTKEIMADLLHPTPAGYQIWADAVQPIIDKYCPADAATPAAGFTAQKPEDIDKTLPTLSFPYETTTPAGTTQALFPVPHADWLVRFAADQQTEKKGPYDFVMDGDSITDGWRGNGRAVWAQRYANLKVLDNGIGGDQVQHVLWRVQNGDLDGLDPKLIMLMIGTNNGNEKSEEIAAGIKLILGEYEKRCPNAHILLLGIFPRDDVATKPVRAHIKEINAILATYSSDPKVTYLDIGDKFLTPDGTLSRDIMPDLLHPNEKGYAIWADAVQPVIDKYFPGAAAK